MILDHFSLFGICACTNYTFLKLVLKFFFLAKVSLIMLVTYFKQDLMGSEFCKDWVRVLFGLDCNRSLYFSTR